MAEEERARTAADLQRRLAALEVALRRKIVTFEEERDAAEHERDAAIGLLIAENPERGGFDVLLPLYFPDGRIKLFAYTGHAPTFAEAERLVRAAIAESRTTYNPHPRG